MVLSRSTAISPLDGRYSKNLDSVRHLLSEYGLMHYRVLIELKWVETLASLPPIQKTFRFSKASLRYLKQIAEHFSEHDLKKIKSFEKITHHDIKAVEYFLKEKFSKQSTLKKNSELIHFGCTSDDINNLSYALIVGQFKEKHLLPTLSQLIHIIKKHAHQHATLALLSRTHGQPASPTTLGKEWANYQYRIQKHMQDITSLSISGKFNGAVGCYNAWVTAYPAIPWDKISKKFVEQLGLTFNPYTTQIEPHDELAKFCHALIRLNTTCIDLTRNIWLYISLDYLTQNLTPKRIGSSTMPHKINPIEFENAEGNLGIANALFNHFALKLPISRWQRDLSDSTVIRNLGVAFSHSFLAYQQLINGLKKLQANPLKMESDLNQHWEILGEAIQTVMRKYRLSKPYEKIKAFSQGQTMTPEKWSHFIDTLKIPADEKKRLKTLTPKTYTGLAARLARKIK